MRRLFFVLGSLALILIAVIAGGISILFYQGNALDRESKAYVDAAIPAITADWSSQQLLARATPELRANANPEQLNALFDRLSRYGHLVRYEGATGQANFFYKIGSGSTISAAYSAKAHFENGDLIFRIALMKRNGAWKIYGFHFEPVPGSGSLQHT